MKQIKVPYKYYNGFRIRAAQIRLITAFIVCSNSSDLNQTNINDLL